MVNILSLVSTSLSALAILPSQDVVAVYNQNFQQVFAQARPLKAKIIQKAKVMEHPVETGIVITDHDIFEPIEIELSMMIQGITSLISLIEGNVNAKSVYAQIQSLYSSGALLTVQTNTATYSNMIIEAMPHEESPEYYDAIPISIKLRQVQFVTAQYETLPPQNVANPADASIQQAGQVQTTDASSSQAQAAALLGTTFYDRNLTSAQIAGFQ